MTTAQALALIKRHGIVLESARGPVPNLAEAIAGETIRGNWWSHPKSHEIYRLVSAVRNSKDVLVCRLVGGKVTFVHRRLWPALVRLARRFKPAQLAELREIHMPTGKHAVVVTPFPRWVPDDVATQAKRMSEETAVTELGKWYARSVS